MAINFARINNDQLKKLPEKLALLSLLSKDKKISAKISKDKISQNLSKDKQRQQR